MTYFLDTDICIFVLRQTFPAITQRMQRHAPDRVKIPSIVKAELLFGAKRATHPKRVAETVERFLEPFEIVPFSDACAVTYAAIRWTLEEQGQVIGPNDLLIAATALAHHGTLVTHNTQEFGRLGGLTIQDWTEPL